ncbi:MAG: hypothetical protein OHK0029_11550 [Armatimonadaceae bacterium]
MISYATNPFVDSDPMHALWETLTSRASVPLVPTGIFDPAVNTALHDAANSAGASSSYNVRAAMFLLNDDLDSAHQLVQPHEDDATANYWHQLVHRREGDWSNARYWVGRTGQHPFYAELPALAADLSQPALTAELTAGSSWHADRMVALSQQASQRGSDQMADLQILLHREMLGLLAWCIANGR